jgi:hypothetical protein
MRTGIIVEVSAADRNSPQKQVWRAQIVLLTAQGCGTAEIIAGSDTGDDRAAAIYTIVQTAKLNGVNPEAYLKDTLTKIAAGHPINKILQLMPWQMLPPAAANLRSRNLRFRSTQKAGGRCSFALHAADQRLTVSTAPYLLVRCSALIIFGHVAPNIRHHSQLIQPWSDRSAR